MAHQVTPDIPALLAATCDLESGHPIEAVLQAHGWLEGGYSAYEVVALYEKRLYRAATAASPAFRQKWAAMASSIRPCVLAIAEYLAANPQP